MEKSLLYYLGFSHFLGIGPTKFTALLKNLSSVEKAYKADKKTLDKIIGQKTAQKFIEFRKSFEPEKTQSEIHKKGITIITQENKQYPNSLKNIPDPPICLYVKGEIKNIDFDKEIVFAVVGTRKPSPYGQQITKYFSDQLAKAGFIIVSGMAMGIDTIAHKGALENNQKTIAVLGCGVDIIYPAINTSLYHQIIKNKGLVVSEFPPGKTVQKGLFVARNRLISGLAK